MDACPLPTDRLDPLLPPVNVSYGVSQRAETAPFERFEHQRRAVTIKPLQPISDN
jgi:hypothetical protein